jgi:hypothetical protein
MWGERSLSFALTQRSGFSREPVSLFFPIRKRESTKLSTLMSLA